MILYILGSGLILGLKHAVEADHVAALSTIASQSRSLKKSARMGASWGLGHSTSLFALGLLILGLKISIPKNVALSFEIISGFVLVLLGLNVIRKLISGKLHRHEHMHEDGQTHSHFHKHGSIRSHIHTHQSFALGVLHGVAGTGALSVLALTSVDSFTEGVLFMIVLSIGTIVGMMTMGALISLPLKFAGKFANTVGMLAGLASIFVGSEVVYGIAKILIT